QNDLGNTEGEHDKERTSQCITQPRYRRSPTVSGQRLEFGHSGSGAGNPACSRLSAGGSAGLRLSPASVSSLNILEVGQAILPAAGFHPAVPQVSDCLRPASRV